MLICAVSSKADIQTALNTYSVVRLERGTIQVLMVWIATKLYGNPSLTRVSITIAAGSSNIVLQDYIQ
jgi:hypothetical protein